MTSLKYEDVVLEILEPVKGLTFPTDFNDFDWPFQVVEDHLMPHLVSDDAPPADVEAGFDLIRRMAESDDRGVRRLLDEGVVKWLEYRSPASAPAAAQWLAQVPEALDATLHREFTERWPRLLAKLELLCPSCHTTVDRAPEDFPTKDLRRRKAKRAQAVSLVGGTPVFDGRDQARCAIERLLLRNRVLFEQKGPRVEDGGTDSIEAAGEWTRCVLEEIVPNSRVILAIVELNAGFASDADLVAAEKLRQHVDDLERKHLGESLLAPSARFPEESNYLFGDNHG